MAMKRRTFVRNSALGSLALGLPFDVSSNRGTPEIPRRLLGKTGEKLSIIGFGGIMLNDNPQEFANEFVAQAFDAGINYFDISPEYGNAQEKLGLAFRPYRDKCFLACKTQKRDAVEAEKQLNESLKAFNTDHFDLYQLHALSSTEEVEKAFAPGGAMEVFTRARQQGKIRFLGFSAHNVEAALLAMKNFSFDTILFPINFNCWNNGDFGPQVYEVAKSKDMGILALKAMALTTLSEGERKLYKNVWYRPIQDDEIARLALRYTLSKELTAAIPPGDAVFFWKAVEVARNFKPVSAAENEILAKLATGLEPVFSHKMA
jgi:predicted aldo/keto reductase-like oxidoreductase